MDLLIHTIPIVGGKQEDQFLHLTTQKHLSYFFQIHTYQLHQGRQKLRTSTWKDSNIPPSVSITFRHNITRVDIHSTPLIHLSRFSYIRLNSTWVFSVMLLALRNTSLAFSDLCLPIPPGSTETKDLHMARLRSLASCILLSYTYFLLLNFT